MIDLCMYVCMFVCMYVCNIYIQFVLIILILTLSFKNIACEGDTM